MTKTFDANQMRAVNWRVVGLIVNARRVQMGWSVDLLASELGISTSTVRRLESQQPCSAYTLGKVMAWTKEPVSVICWQSQSQEMRRAA
nr:hypothetical protein [uncultured Cohaesibacter sp.]